MERRHIFKRPTLPVLALLAGLGLTVGTRRRQVALG